MRILTLDQLKEFHVAGDVTAVILRADGAEFEIQIVTASGVHRLAGRERFSEPHDALLLLLSVGIHDVRVDSVGWIPGTEPDGDGAVHRKIRAALAGHLDGSNPSHSPDDWGRLRERKKAQRDAL